MKNKEELLEAAWTIIATVDDGHWEQSEEWQKNAERWRYEWKWNKQSYDGGYHVD